MKTKHQYIYRILILISCLLATSLAQAATYNINFFDQSKQQVGQGQFTTDPTKIITVYSSSPPDTYSTRQNPVTSFSATIQGVTWGLEGSLWWKSGDQAPGHQFDSRYGSGPADGGWFLGDPYFGRRQLTMSFNQATDSLGSGTWSQQAGYTQNGSPLPQWIYGDGTWTASVVATPIPAAVWLFMSGLGLLGIVKRKRQ